MMATLGSSVCVAQKFIGPIGLDPEYANNGKWELDFDGYDDIATTFVAGRNACTLVGGKIMTGTPGIVRFGIARVFWEGPLDKNFGKNGKVELGWGAVDYPLSILPMWDSSLMCGGASRDSLNGTSVFPTVFRLKTNGTPDLSFNKNGRAVFEYSSGATGEFDRTDSIQVPVGQLAITRFLAFGYSEIGAGSKQYGFYCVRFDSTGKLDSSFGYGGKSFSEEPIHFAKGYRRSDLKGIFVGLTDSSKPEIVLEKIDLLTGSFDLAFGTNGLYHTGIFLHGGDSLLSDLQKDDKLLVAAPVEDTSTHIPFTLMRFNPDGSLDMSYGTKGFTSSPLIARIHSPGLTISNDGSALVCGREDVGLGQSIIMKFIIDGTLDSTFGYNGIINIDADSGLRRNYMTGFNSVGQKKFIGVGSSFNPPGNANFLIARYVPVNPPDTAAVQARQIPSPLSIYPNPARGIVNIRTPDEAIKSITIIDALGRTVRSFERPMTASNSDQYFFDLSDLSNGMYLCMVKTLSGSYSGRLTVNH
jgi:uncharacterized delta-60 repeat protein